MTLRLGSSGRDVGDLIQQLHTLGFGPPACGNFIFAKSTLESVVAYQRWAGLRVDGVAGPQTQCALIADCRAKAEAELHDFRGSLGLTLRLEGHRGEPYWPGGQSGVTLDPGFDLGHQTPERLESLYGALWTSSTLRWLGTAIGLQGPEAERWLQESEQDGRLCLISREAAAEVLPRVAGEYWRTLVDRFTGLVDGSGASHSAMLSLGYNRGAMNPALDCLSNSVLRHDYGVVADMIERMGQGKPEGIVVRRRVEAGHLRSAGAC